MKENKEIPIGARYHYEVFKDEETGRPNTVRISVQNEKEAVEVVRNFWRMHNQESQGGQGPFNDLSDDQFLEQLTFATDRTTIYRSGDKLTLIIQKNGRGGLTEWATGALKKLGFNLGV